MENLVSTEIMISIVGGGIISVIVSLLKGPLQRFSPRLLVAGVSILSGILYYVFYTYMPEMLKQEIVNFVYGTLSSAVFIYAFIWKGLKGEAPQIKATPKKKLTK